MQNPPRVLRREPARHLTDYDVRINRELMDEIDGPMLLHGLQEMDGRPLALPKRRADYPSKERLAERFDAAPSPPG